MAEDHIILAYQNLYIILMCIANSPCLVPIDLPKPIALTQHWLWEALLKSHTKKYMFRKLFSLKQALDHVKGRPFRIGIKFVMPQ